MARGAKDGERGEGTTRVSAPRESGRTAFVLLVWPSTVQRFPLPEVGATTVGRGADCELRIDDDSLSRRHARIVVDGNRVTIEDLGSRNGTRVQGRSVESHAAVELAVGSIAELGDIVVALQHQGSSAEAAASVPPPPARSGAVVCDPAMKGIYQLLEVIGPSDAAVLVLGETGTGKELVARELHARSRRSEHRLLTLSCAALPESTLEAELFGFERGAFTGAVQGKPGLFESADGGTVFLDEIGELVLTTQAKLLRFLESGETMRLGSVRPKNVDVRVVSATHRDLAADVGRNMFRADLFFRLNGISVEIPPLRERLADIVPLAELFLARAAARSRRAAPALAADARSALLQHAWPGNVRELKNVVERALLLLPATGGAITAAQLDLRGLTPRLAGAVPAAAAAPVPLATSLRSDVDALAMQRILSVLEATGGNQSEAARRLGINRGTLLVKLDQFGIARPRKGR